MNSQSEMEIASIERELEILRSRYSLMQRWAAVTKHAALAAGVLIFIFLVTAIVWAIMIGNSRALAVGVPLLLVLLLFVVGLWGRVRWIDVIAWGPRFVRENEAHAIERMICEREARLKRLREGAGS
jgi:hypothetical protein